MERPHVLFVCRENAGRSQLARALYAARGGSARCAGTAPATEIHEAVLEALDEVGLAPADPRPREVTDDDLVWADLVVTMGCGDECAVPPETRHLDWRLADPAGLCLEEVRELRADIERRVAELP